MKWILIISLIIVALCTVIVVRAVQNAGYGSCAHCGKTWNRVDSYTIPYRFTEDGYMTMERRMFPLCVKCYKRLPPENIVFYVQELANEWNVDSEGYISQEEIQCAIDFVYKDKEEK